MLSILIPIYNQDVRNLVYSLAKQCNKANINYQILCFDDLSDEKYRMKNRELATKTNINYTELTENLGRSRIRNWLGKAAYFEYLLYLDGDSKVSNKNFIANYIAHLESNTVLYGGRVYQKNKPKAVSKILHWKYGTTRESVKAKTRNKKPYLHFQSNNFIIPQHIFNTLHFDEKIKGYGYEDLLYALDLKRLGISISHINNPIIHDGLETTKQFLTKTKKATENLAILFQREAIQSTRLIDFYRKLDYFGLLKYFITYYPSWHQFIEKNLASRNPSIIMLTLWKLYIFTQFINPTQQPTKP